MKYILLIFYWIVVCTFLSNQIIFIFFVNFQINAGFRFKINATHKNKFFKKMEIILKDNVSDLGWFLVKQNPVTTLLKNYLLNMAQQMIMKNQL